VLGFSALEAGLGFVPLAVSAGIGGPVAGRLASRLGARAVVPASLLITAACLLALSRAPAGGSYVTALLPAFLVSGFTFAAAAVPLTAEAVADALPAEKGVAAALFQTCTHVGGAIVLAALVIAAAARTRSAGGNGIGALVAGYQLAFLLTAGLLAAGTVPALMLPADSRRRSRRRSAAGSLAS
jgi:MFS family permease